MEHTITYCGKTFKVIVTDNDTLADLKLKIESLIGVSPPNQKLLHKAIKPSTPNATLDSTLLSVLFPTPSKILLVGSTQSTLSQIQKESNILEIRKKRENLPSRPVEKEAVEWTFGTLTPLPEFADRSNALIMLKKLRDDVGIKAIMKKYKWKVGELAELHPAAQTILGYNQNRGQRIALRLRTDRLDGFRHYPEVRRVLIHELTHMVHDDHDNKFHELNRLLTKECATFGTGYTILKTGLGGGAEETDDSIDSGGRFQGGSFTLGGQGPKPDAPLREVLAGAAELRLTKEEIEMVEGCGQKQGKDV
ncbi:hypothetical protein HDV05_002276 [Chytridiales sp. JEL 0842]|nr:hypothetical protein HDV05_002276 [Chytridiales sp. JEL 0842]